MELRLVVILTVFAAAAANVNAARRIILRPLSAEEVVTILKLAGREDVVPEGRVVTEGLAAIKGFALGLTKGIGGSLLFDVATSNATSEFINSFNATAMMEDFQGINMTALAHMFKWESKNNTSAIKYKTTEICFNTRAEKPIVNHAERQADLSPTTDALDTDTNILTNPRKDGDDGVTTDTIETDTDINTKTSTFTQIETGGEQTCIVVQSPILRKRRSSHRRRRH